VDATPFSGLSYYRLKQTDLDGNAEFLGLRSVSIKPAVAEIYPNPVNGTQLNVKVESSNDPYVVKVINLSGKELFREYYSSADENGTLQIHLSEKPFAGMYLLQIYTNNHLYTQKFIVE